MNMSAGNVDAYDIILLCNIFKCFTDEPYICICKTHGIKRNKHNITPARAIIHNNCSCHKVLFIAVIILVHRITENIGKVCSLCIFLCSEISRENRCLAVPETPDFFTLRLINKCFHACIEIIILVNIKILKIGNCG